MAKGAKLGHALPIWLMADTPQRGRRPNALRGRATGTWHHQIGVGKRPSLYARSRKGGKGANHVLTGVAQSSLPSKIEKGLDWLHRRRRLVGKIRLLIAPRHNVTALWCVIGDEAAVVPVEVPRPLRRKILVHHPYMPDAFAALLLSTPYVQRKPVDTPKT
jgi:hypothetical protein